MFVVIINLAADIILCGYDELDTLYIPILLSYCDNTSACAWINNLCRAGLIGRALCQFFMGLLMSTDISTPAEWLSTTDNKLADENTEFYFSCLVHDHPQLQGCRRLQASYFFLSKMHSILLRQCSPDPMELRELRPIDLGVITSKCSLSTRVMATSTRQWISRHRNFVAIFCCS